MWGTSGAAASAVLLKDIFPGSIPAFYPGGPRFFVWHKGLLYFAATDDTHGCELWQTDGTPEGTHMVEDLAPGFSSSFPLGAIVVGDELYYAVLDDGTGRGAIRKLVPAGQPPFAGGALTTVTGEAAWLSFADLLAGLPAGVTVQSAGATAAGGVVVLEDGGLRYTPPAGHQGEDTFVVTLSDGQQGTVVVTVHRPEWLERVEIVSRTGSELRLRFHYTTGKEADIERSTDLREWETVATAAGDADGGISFTDAPPPAGTAYYRLQESAR